MKYIKLIRDRAKASQTVLDTKASRDKYEKMGFQMIEHGW